MTIPRIKFGEKSIGDSPKSPKCFPIQIRAQEGVNRRSNYKVGVWSRWIDITRFKLGEKSIGDGQNDSLVR